MIDQTSERAVPAADLPSEAAVGVHDWQFMHEVDEFLARIDLAANDDELRQLFDTFGERYDLDVPEDPFSDRYRDKQFQLYQRLAGKAYSASNEVTKFDVADLSIRPFPYFHSSSGLVGDHLMAIGFVIKAMGLPPGSRILELGPGWGNITMALAKMGYSVTAIDIEEDFVDLIGRRAAMEGLSIELIHGDFSTIDKLDKRFDAVLFFECFHHSPDHYGLIRSCDSVLDPGGIICFAAEPINENFPIPWGLRMDGQSVWAIRKNGWLELGFNIRYFAEVLDRNGFVCVEHRGSDSPASHALIARRASEFAAYKRASLFSFEANELRSNCGAIVEGRLSVLPEDRGVACYGPYRPFSSGHYELLINFEGEPVPRGVVDIDVACDGGTTQIARFDSVDLAARRSFEARFKLPTKVSDLEVRIVTSGGAFFEMRDLKISTSHLVFTEFKTNDRVGAAQ